MGENELNNGITKWIYRYPDGREEEIPSNYSSNLPPYEVHTGTTINTPLTTSSTTSGLTALLSPITTSWNDINAVDNNINKKKKKVKVDKNTKEKVFFEDGKIKFAKCNNGYMEESKRIAMSDIVDVKSFANRKVVVYFSDGTSEQCVVDKEDTFSLEQGITICVMKKLLGGTSAYAKVVDRGMKVYKKKEKERAEAKAETERKKKAHDKYVAKKKRRDENKRKEIVRLTERLNKLLND